MLKLTTQNNNDSMVTYIIEQRLRCLLVLCPMYQVQMRAEGRKRRRSSVRPERIRSGHMVKSRMTVIQVGWGAT